MKRDILRFISQFKDAKSTFLNGCCYWFAFILKERFDGVILYHPIQNHFATKIGRELYDVTGEISDDGFMRWQEFPQYDQIEYYRIVRDCINKTE